MLVPIKIFGTVDGKDVRAAVYTSSTPNCVSWSCNNLGSRRISLHRAHSTFVCFLLEKSEEQRNAAANLLRLIYGKLSETNMVYVAVLNLYFMHSFY